MRVRAADSLRWQCCFQLNREAESSTSLFSQRYVCRALLVCSCMLRFENCRILQPKHTKVVVRISISATTICLNPIEHIESSCSVSLEANGFGTRQAKRGKS